MQQSKPKLNIKVAEFVTSAGRPDQFLKDPVPHFVFAGRSNVGKSSLLNAITNKKGLAKTSATPGKTRLINYFRINNDFFFVDVPGYGYAAVSKEMSTQWGGLMDTYLAETPQIACIFQLLDVRHDPTPQDFQMIEWMLYEGRPFKLVLTKTDKLTNNQLKLAIERLARLLAVRPSDVIATSSQSGMGMTEMLQFIYETNQVMKKRIKEDMPWLSAPRPPPKAAAAATPEAKAPAVVGDKVRARVKAAAADDDDDYDEPPIEVRVVM